MNKTRTDDAEAIRAVAERFELIRRISDDLAHELKNPLNAMVINLEVLRARVRAGAADAAVERIGVLEQETRRLHGLLDHMLRFVRPDHAGETDFPLTEVLEEVCTIVQVLAKLRRTEFRVGPISDGVFVHTVREPLRFALLALSEAAIAPVSPDQPAARLEVHANGDRATLLLAAPASALSRLEPALAFARRVLTGLPVVAEADLGADSCTVRVLVPRT